MCTQAAGSLNRLSGTSQEGFTNISLSDADALRLVWVHHPLGHVLYRQREPPRSLGAGAARLARLARRHSRRPVSHCTACCSSALRMQPLEDRKTLVNSSFFLILWLRLEYQNILVYLKAIQYRSFIKSAIFLMSLFPHWLHVRGNMRGPGGSRGW